MSIIKTLEEKFGSQDKYDHEINTEKNMVVYFRLGTAVMAMHWRDILELDQPHKITKHTEECLRKQSVVCPKCGNLVLVEQHEVMYEGTYYDAFCKSCYWSSDDEGGREPINQWLGENDYCFSCDCPLVEEPPQAENTANYIFRALGWKNEESSEF